MLSRMHLEENVELKRRTAAPRDSTPSTTPGTSPQRTPPLHPQADPSWVADVVGQHGTPVCAEGAAVADAAALLLSSNRTAAVVLSVHAEPIAIFSEGDVLGAYLAETPWPQTVGEWLRRSHDSAPLAPRAIAGNAPLREAASLLLARSSSLGGGARQELVVEGAGGSCGAILSALDLARAACGCPDLAQDSEVPSAATTSALPMHVRGTLPAVSPQCTVKQLLRAAATARQGAVLVADTRGVHALVTPRDLVRAYVRQVPTHDTVQELLAALDIKLERRLIDSSTPAWRAAAVMAEVGSHHLLVTRPERTEVLGAVSALDLACTALGVPLAPSPQTPAGPPTVADAIGRRESPTCPGSNTLSDACDDLIYTGRSAAVVVGEDGEVLGLLTENDLLRAYASGAFWNTHTDVWLRNEMARCPASTLKHLMVEPTASLAEAAALMARQSHGEAACHHLLVKVEGHCTALSSLDVARLLCVFDPEHIVAAGVAVGTAMKPRGALPEIAPGCTLIKAFDVLATSHQNCALVVGLGGAVRGIITPRDVLRAFADHLPGTSSVDGWLRAVGSSLELRTITRDARLADAAAVMAVVGVHHLLVVEAGAEEPVGVVSSLDIAHALASGRQAGTVVRNWHVAGHTPV